MNTESRSQKSAIGGRREPARSALDRSSQRKDALNVFARRLACLVSLKTRRRCFASLAFLVVALTAHAQSYSIDWSKIAGGGGTSTGGVYAVSGTIGQPDAGGPMTNGQYSVTGGFWSLVNVVQTPGAPLLAITFAANQAIVSWSPSVTGWTLQTNNNLATGTWGNYLGTVSNNRVTNSALTGDLFFRLKQP